MAGPPGWAIIGSIQLREDPYVYTVWWHEARQEGRLRRRHLYERRAELPGGRRF